MEYPRELFSSSSTETLVIPFDDAVNELKERLALYSDQKFEVHKRLATYEKQYKELSDPKVESPLTENQKQVILSILTQKVNGLLRSLKVLQEPASRKNDSTASLHFEQEEPDTDEKSLHFKLDVPSHEENLYTMNKVEVAYRFEKNPDAFLRAISVALEKGHCKDISEQDAMAFSNGKERLNYLLAHRNDAIITEAALVKALRFNYPSHEDSNYQEALDNTTTRQYAIDTQEVLKDLDAENVFLQVINEAQKRGVLHGADVTTLPPLRTGRDRLRYLLDHLDQTKTTKQQFIQDLRYTYRQGGESPEEIDLSSVIEQLNRDLPKEPLSHQKTAESPAVSPPPSYGNEDYKDHGNYKLFKENYTAKLSQLIRISAAQFERGAYIPVDEARIIDQHIKDDIRTKRMSAGAAHSIIADSFKIIATERGEWRIKPVKDHWERLNLFNFNLPKRK